MPIITILVMQRSAVGTTPSVGRVPPGDSAAGPERDLILTITYIVVVFSIIVQGLTIGKLVKSIAAAKVT